MNDVPFHKDLEKLVHLTAMFEQAADEREYSRLANELLCTIENTTLFARRYLAPFLKAEPRTHLPHILPYDVGEQCAVEVTCEGWVRIHLDTLLHSNRRHVTAYIESTLLQILYGHRTCGGHLPWYEHAVVCIIEHSEKYGMRHTFDPDNKEWKCILNALKGVLFADDDSRTVSLFLDSMPDGKSFTEVIILPYSEVKKPWTKR